MDVQTADYTIDLTATPVLHEVIDAKLDGDGCCGVRDVVIVESSGTKVTVFADFNNQLKSVCQRGEETCSSVLKVVSEPWSITVISEGKIAVSFHLSPRLNIVAVTPDLEVLFTIQTSKIYRGLSALDQSTLVASSKNPPSVDLIDMQGNILKTLPTLPAIGKSPFFEPRYIHVTSQGTILVSDWGLKSVTCLTQAGDVVFTYTPTGDRALTRPWGITSTSSGDILVADYGLQKVIHLSKTGDYIRDILTSGDEVQSPSGLCVDGDKLCVVLANMGLHKYKFQ